MYKVRIKFYLLQYNLHYWLLKWFPLCHGFDSPCFHIGQWRQQNTAYNDDKKNYVFMCNKCFECNEEYWEEMWMDYYTMTCPGVVR